MKTQEQLKTIIEVFIDFGLDKAQAYAIGNAVKAYGDNRFNEALDKAAEEAEIHYPISNNLNPCVNPQSILSLKIPTS